MTRALVTGASGFIGSHLVDALVQRGTRVRCLVRKSSDVRRLRDAGVELVVGELDQPETLREALAGVDEVHHLAAMTAALHPQDMDRVNHLGCRFIAEACAQQATPPKLILVSSIAAAGPVARGKIREETDPEHPVSHYGRSKLAGEMAAIEFADRVPMSIVRPGIVFGPRNRALLPVLRSIKYLNLHVIPGYDVPPLSFIHVEDLVDVLLRVADSGQRVPGSTTIPPRSTPTCPQVTGDAGTHPADGFYFAVSPEYPTWADMGRTIGQFLRRPHVFVVPCLSPVPWLIAGASELLQRVRKKADELNFDKIREAMVPSWACSAKTVERDVGFTPRKSLTERWEETVGWYRTTNWV